MIYVVFESGSRAGFSTEMFFRAWQKENPNSNVSLLMADSDKDYILVPTSNKSIRRVSDNVAQSILLHHSDTRVFPGDELTRQSNHKIQEKTSLDPLSSVSSWFYDKVKVNTLLSEIIGNYSKIRIPKTFACSDIFIKPATMSAGSKGLEHKENSCVSEWIDIDKEFVIDILEKDGQYSIYARETKLRSGYDKMIKFISDNEYLVDAVKDFLSCIKGSKLERMFSGIFHLQIAQDSNGTFYYIESSKRISGTSISNIFRGYNPFNLTEGTEAHIYDNPFEYYKWYRYEDIVYELRKII